MEKRKSTYRVEERRSKAFVDPGASGSAAEEETPAASQLRKLDAMFASGTTADLTVIVADDPIARIAAIDEKYAGFDNAVANEAQSRLGALDARLAAWDDAEGGIRPTE